ncbi:hypothetical protein BSR29_08170 [Boudabousia liubingyangii]|uniref:GAF domain-containing protein n=1 Tax=Boudabousia liubingyangii TaxID=1921764 RepID=A0A1Q5PJ87_9ACTO|nr:GAF domain-containing protein [Boudabousia liubingyangii]OKL45950.1 hypothetical protein BSR29_08170 [Boudabousia liubingyangii]OKL47774.1 hypothetical protein BSR28_04660 [Boudabousia liubingyangii]
MSDELFTIDGVPSDDSLPDTVISDPPESALLNAIIQVSSHHSAPEILTDYVKFACQLSGAAYGAFVSINVRGEIAKIFPYQIDDSVVKEFRGQLMSDRILSSLPDSGALVANEELPREYAEVLPSGLGNVKNYVGIALTLPCGTFGWLYLANHPEAFDVQCASELLKLTDAVVKALDNALEFEQAQKRERWVKASQGLTTMLLSGASEEEALEETARLLREVSDSDSALIILPSIGDTWACEFVAGESAQGLLGQVFPPNGRAMTVARTGQGVIIDSLADTLHLKVAMLSAFGPALYVPMRNAENSLGVILLLRQPGDEEFTVEDLSSAQMVASHAALALELATAKHRAAVADLQAEKERIGQDLHDLAIQQLFAAGMQISTLKAAFLDATSRLEKETAESAGIDESALLEQLEGALTQVGDSAEQIRAIVRSLRTQGEDVLSLDRTFLDLLAQEASLGRSSLGFAPTFILQINGEVLDNNDEDFEEKSKPFETEVPETLVKNAVAVIRESLANIAKHANATAARVTLDLDSSEGCLAIEITDNGKGMPEALTRQSGLKNMRMRAESNDGWFRVANRSTGGARILWKVPLG